MRFQRYQIPFVLACVFHLSILLALAYEPVHKNPTFSPSLQQAVGEIKLKPEPERETIKAVSVDAEEVQKSINQLKAKRVKERMAEEKHQRDLKKQADLALKKRQDEQLRIEKLKKESEKLALARRKELEALDKRKREEEKQIAEMKTREVQLKKEQEQEIIQLAELRKQKEEKERAMAESKRQDDLKQATLDSEKQAQMMGEVNRFKALIINSISRQWILPENVDRKKDCQFRIRLAPTGEVLEVTLTRSSGDAVLDRSAQSAIFKASPLPVPNDPIAFNVFRDIRLTVRPENARG